MPAPCACVCACIIVRAHVRACARACHMPHAAVQGASSLADAFKNWFQHGVASCITCALTLHKQALPPTVHANHACAPSNANGSHAPPTHCPPSPSLPLATHKHSTPKLRSKWAFGTCHEQDVPDLRRGLGHIEGQPESPRTRRCGAVPRERRNRRQVLIPVRLLYVHVETCSRVNAGRACMLLEWLGSAPTPCSGEHVMGFVCVCACGVGRDGMAVTGCTRPPVIAHVLIHGYSQQPARRSTRAYGCLSC